MNPRARRLSFLAGLLAFAASFPGLAQGPWPDQPVRVVVSSAAGGSTDLVTRMIMPHVAAALGKPVVVENRPGASGMIAAAEVSKAKPDGHTYLAIFGWYAANRTLFPQRQYRESDFTGVTMFGRYPLILVTGQTGPRNLGELLERARAQPGTVTFATGGSGTLSHLMAELFMQSANIRMTHVPYKAGSTAIPDLIGGRVDLTFEQLSILGPHIQSGKMRALGVTSARRSTVTPDIPTLAENGVPGVAGYAWMGLLSLSQAPAAAVQRMSREVVAALRRPEVTQMLTSETYGMEVLAFTPEQTNQFIEAETALWRDVITKGKITSN